MIWITKQWYNRTRLFLNLAPKCFKPTLIQNSLNAQFTKPRVISIIGELQLPLAVYLDDLLEHLLLHALLEIDVSVQLGHLALQGFDGGSVSATLLFDFLLVELLQLVYFHVQKCLELLVFVQFAVYCIFHAEIVFGQLIIVFAQFLYVPLQLLVAVFQLGIGTNQLLVEFLQFLVDLPQLLDETLPLLQLLSKLLLGLGEFLDDILVLQSDLLQFPSHALNFNLNLATLKLGLDHYTSLLFIDKILQAHNLPLFQAALVLPLGDLQTKLLLLDHQFADLSFGKISLDEHLMLLNVLFFDLLSEAQYLFAVGLYLILFLCDDLVEAIQLFSKLCHHFIDLLMFPFIPGFSASSLADCSLKVEDLS